jgi:hypothetical protein
MPARGGHQAALAQFQGTAFPKRNPSGRWTAWRVAKFVREETLLCRAPEDEAEIPFDKPIATLL